MEGGRLVGPRRVDATGGGIDCDVADCPRDMRERGRRRPGDTLIVGDAREDPRLHGNRPPNGGDATVTGRNPNAINLAWVRRQLLGGGPRPTAIDGSLVGHS